MIILILIVLGLLIAAAYWFWWRKRSNINTVKEQVKLAVENRPVTPNQAWQELVAGNKRLVGKNPKRKVCYDDNSKLKNEKKPFAVVLACSEIDTMPEEIFDQNLGDLFVVRVAGNVVTQTQLESILYAVEHSGSSIIIVLGHQGCGVVDAVLKNDTENIKQVAAVIRPALLCAGSQKRLCITNLSQAVQAHVHNMVELLKHEPHLQVLIAQGKIDVHGANYQIDNKEVKFIT